VIKLEERVKEFVGSTPPVTIGSYKVGLANLEWMGERGCRFNFPH